MNIVTMRLLLLALSVLALGAVLGTALWLKLGPRSRFATGPVAQLQGLQNYGTVPEFSLTERSGRRTSLADLRGAIWIADFIYTSCTDTCPLQSAEMAKLQEELKNQPAFKLVSISVDPRKDTPKVLSEYSARYRADAERWLFVTGDSDEIARLVQQGFRLSAMPLSGQQAEGIIMHSPRFVLVDQNAQIRGYYDSRDPEALKRLRTDVARLSNS